MNDPNADLWTRYEKRVTDRMAEDEILRDAERDQIMWVGQTLSDILTVTITEVGPWAATQQYGGRVLVALLRAWADVIAEDVANGVGS